LTQFPKNPVLIVDDEESALESFETTLNLNGFNNVLKCQDSREVLTLLIRQNIACILLDINMPHKTGLELLEEVKNDFPGIPIIIITGIDEIETAVDCMKKGAEDYMVKPVEKNRLISGLKRVLELKEMKRKYTLLKDHFFSHRINHPEAFSDIVTNNGKMKSIFEYIEVIASSPEPVLISGETGVGKELIARSIHKLSERDGKFIAVNVAGVEDNIFSDTLFGHAKGAFTDAHQARAGMIEQASRGTLFLDEIGEIKRPSQVKLLRLLQEYEYYPLGSDMLKFSDARIIVATNHELESLMTSGEFRKDLYHRICVHNIHIPPLRERLEDIPLLVDFFLEQSAKKLKKKKPTPPKELNTLLQTYHFPGNIRELRAMIFNAVSMHKSKMLSLDAFKAAISKDQNLIPSEISETAQTTDSLLSSSQILPSLKQMNQILIDEAMKRAEGNQAIAARMLGITRQALNRRLKKPLNGGAQ
jgi:DNA-binding NtrC family response regulator